MGIQKDAAIAVSAVSTAALKYVFRRPAANFPGKVALYVDPRIIADMAGKLAHGSICVVGTNGKTTVNNMIADALEADGLQVVCNRTGANLDSGVATSLLHAKQADWGVFECDELWLAKILPHLQSKYVLLLNLFRDQLDRCGEIDRIQNSIAEALASSPETVLIYNGDDPLCEAVARKAPNRSLSFGIGENLGLPQNTVSDARMCQMCEGMLEYTYRQYGQLGDFHCMKCDFSRRPLEFSARKCHVSEDGMSFDVVQATQEAACTQKDNASQAGAVDSANDAQSAHSTCGSDSLPGTIAHVDARYSGVYMIYNLLAVYATAHLMGAGNAAIETAVDAFDPQNGRLQQMQVMGRPVLLNLAKNPTGFNQNLKLVTSAQGRKAAAFFINDKEADGRDISWLWDVDFQELAAQPQTHVYAGGIRRNDLQLRLKYAGVASDLVESAADAMTKIDALPKDYRAYMIANYTSLPGVRADLMRLADENAASLQTAASAVSATAATDAPAVGPNSPSAAVDGAASSASLPAGITPENPLVIVHCFPDLLNLYGDGGNIEVLRRRCEWRGIPVEVRTVEYGQALDFSTADIVFLGGGPDREQKLASEELLRMKDQLQAYVEDDGVLLAICGGYQILGPTWLMGEGEVEGLGILDISTKRAGVGFDRLIGNIVIQPEFTTRPVVGYENHAGRTYLGEGLSPFGTVVGNVGFGNNDNDKADGVVYKNLIGTYMHGPLLGKNPQVADWLISHAIDRRCKVSFELAVLDDAVENEANDYMCGRLKAAN